VHRLDSIVEEKTVRYGDFFFFLMRSINFITSYLFDGDFFLFLFLSRNQ
jgi:hypothetical protein